MLIIRVFSNLRQIDEIHIKNTDDLKDGKCLYTIMKPEGFLEPKIEHERKKKYYRLLRDALNLILGE